MFYNEDHLRVTKPLTSDGMTPLVDDEDRIQKKIVHLPLSAKKILEQQNERLPKHLRMKIEVVSVNGVKETESEAKRPGRPKKVENETN